MDGRLLNTRRAFCAVLVLAWPEFVGCQAPQAAPKAEPFASRRLSSCSRSPTGSGCTLTYRDPAGIRPVGANGMVVIDD
jgi:hypothetical protein